MGDQCEHCESRGNIDMCLATDCFLHENWMSKKLLEKIYEQYSELNNFRNMINEVLEYWKQKKGIGEQHMGKDLNTVVKENIKC
jgi:hypothetical protein